MCRAVATHAGPRPRLLIVDDDRAILTLVGTIALKEGFDVATAINGEDALRQRSAHPSDLVLLDLQMPGVTGIDVLRSISDVRRGCRVVLTSGYATIHQDARRRPREQGGRGTSAGNGRRAFYRQLERHGLHHRTPSGPRLPISSEEGLEQAS